MPLGLTARHPVMDPHVIVSFPPDEAVAPQVRPDHAEPGDFILVDDTMGFDMRVGDRKQRKAEAAVASATVGARDRGASVKVTAKEGGNGSGGKKGGAKGEGTKTSAVANAAKPAGPMPKGWQCLRKTHKSGQKAGQTYKVYLSPGGQQYLSYASAQPHFGTAKPKLPPTEAAPVRAEFLPPDWMLRKRKRGDEYLGPAGQRIGSWHALAEHLAVADEAEVAAAVAAQPSHDRQPAGDAAATAADYGGNVGADTDLLGTASWLWRLAREVHIGMPSLSPAGKRCARHIRLLRMARSKH